MHREINFMKKIYIASLLLIATMLSVTANTRYFVGNTPVSETFWNAMPDSLEYSTSVFDLDSVVIMGRELPITHYLDSVTAPGQYLLMRRSEKDIAILEQAFGAVIRQSRARGLHVVTGDTAPQIALTRYLDNKPVQDFIRPGRCYLISFWATWCGNCLHELQQEYIPAVAKCFADNPSFRFVPVCIDSSVADLEQFFDSERGAKWRHIAAITYLDRDRRANSLFGVSGVMPLNVVIGTDGIIHYIHSGAVTTPDALTALRQAIECGLR